MRLALASVVVLLAAGCGGTDGGSDAGCPSDLPKSCPSPAPSYADVQPIFEARCVRCHGPGGAEANLPLDTYDRIFQRRTTALNQIYNCIMPPPGEPQLSSDERAKLLAWFVCGAPQ